MKAIFIRKVFNLEELKKITEMDLKIGRKGVSYEVTKEVKLSDNEFKNFSEIFLKDQSWITEGEDGGMNKNGQIRCIRVKNEKTGEKILVNSEGYKYSRYTALELD
ncbi:DUF6329 domain-containing protein [Paramaledivibacter caminithermalis]|uniref:DUF6329 domain-containing protein n=1 Tax=Paramaledivibacter caminithermalis (strain DSM 15212 / CIP 107654 / DViRD3) TaxID=1121301 RepID=A0A1M6M2M5_PARC5|nr:DUF6329 domain-containing protein [Paramaledivibacter caminithermalis]SHJ77669.1 hypothetical protein SAMN02745912_01050 [Paramaledivibacter caminithermalis DSM 15212]